MENYVTFIPLDKKVLHIETDMDCQKGARTKIKTNKMVHDGYVKNGALLLVVFLCVSGYYHFYPLLFRPKPGAAGPMVICHQFRTH